MPRRGKEQAGASGDPDSSPPAATQVLPSDGGIRSWWPPRRRRLAVAVVAAVLLLLGAGWLSYRLTRFAPDTTPEGAYQRIASAIAAGEPEACFAYLEQDAQHASFTIARYSAEITALIRSSYPEPERTAALRRYEPAAAAGDGPRLWALLAQSRGWIGRLRRDLSGAERCELAGERATVVTSRGTRYSFRRRPNGIWGLTMFTAELTAEAEHLARDLPAIRQAAEDYRQAGR